MNTVYVKISEIIIKVYEVVKDIVVWIMLADSGWETIFRAMLLPVCIIGVAILCQRIFIKLRNVILGWIDSKKDYSNYEIKDYSKEKDGENFIFKVKYKVWQKNKYEFLKKKFPIGTIIKDDLGEYVVFNHYIEMAKIINRENNTLKTSFTTNNFSYLTKPKMLVEIDKDTKNLGLKTRNTQVIVGSKCYNLEKDQDLIDLIDFFSKNSKGNVNIKEVNIIKNQIKDKKVNKFDKVKIIEIIKTGIELCVSVMDIINNIARYIQ